MKHLIYLLSTISSSLVVWNQNLTGPHLAPASSLPTHLWTTALFGHVIRYIPSPNPILKKGAPVPILKYFTPNKAYKLSQHSLELTSTASSEADQSKT